MPGTIAAVFMAVVIGLIMAAIFERSPQKCETPPDNQPTQTIQATTEPPKNDRTERIAVLFLALLYMPTLLEVPIVGTLFGYSTGVTAPGLALSLLLAGPSLSLPSMIVITRVIGLKKGGVYISLVVIVATLVSMLYGAIVS